MAKRLARVKRRQALLAELQVQLLENRQRLERELFKKPPLSPGLFLETAGVHPDLLANAQVGTKPPVQLPGEQPLLLLTDRERTHLPLPTPEELEPMEPAEQQLAALLSGPDPLQS